MALAPSSEGTAGAGGRAAQSAWFNRATTWFNRSSQQLGRAACTPCSQRIWTQGQDEWLLSRGSSSDSPHSAKGPLSITSVREIWVLFPRNSVAKHSIVLRDKQECPSSDPKRSLAFFTPMLFERDKSWSNTVSVSTGNKPPSTAISWWGWLGAGGSSPGH